jgi:hypothetical protein
MDNQMTDKGKVLFIEFQLIKKSVKLEYGHVIQELLISLLIITHSSSCERKMWGSWHFLDEDHSGTTEACSTETELD